MNGWMTWSKKSKEQWEPRTRLEEHWADEKYEKNGIKIKKNRKMGEKCNCALSIRSKFEFQSEKKFENPDFQVKNYFLALNFQKSDFPF